ncbi:hypothetical protein GCM10017056_39380 [Seohaeicola zhoushanensis]|uniref:histidine kinase n=1 Tax=Seohaeicola zhoushanensis TaxID=1569283 RepID=A0A8J3MA32_9RHOB|nr:hypothetical protein GCM10017056_39380 [Seohaeicola zhoushanensis]
MSQGGGSDSRTARVGRGGDISAEAIAALQRQLTEAHEFQAATRDVLAIIASSPSNAQPVFEAIAESAARLTGSFYCNVQLFDGEVIRPGASMNFSSKALNNAAYLSGPPTRKSLIGRAILDCATVHLTDVTKDPEYSSDYARSGGWRTAAAVPMMQHGRPLGAIAVGKFEAEAFTDTQLRVLETLADHAVIAIENVRQFEEAQARNRQLRESLERQQAMSEILGVISSKPTSPEPVFEAIARNALHLCDALFANVFVWKEGQLHFMASAHKDVPFAELMRARYPMRPDRTQVSGRVMLSGKVIRIEDSGTDTEYDQSFLPTVGRRRLIGVPMLREGETVGVIVIAWSEPGEIPESSEALLKSFADQAVIAIENARLFHEVQLRNAELTEALEQQTATSEILTVISNSLSDTQPVFDAIVRSGCTLFPDAIVSVVMPKEDKLHLIAVAASGSARVESLRGRFPIPISREYLHGVAILDRTFLDVPDAREVPAQLKPGANSFLVSGNRALAVIPLLRGAEAIGAISVIRAEPGRFSDKQRGILKTFADQAVIAIENARLLNELRESLQQQTATADVLKVISRSAFDLQAVLDTLAESAARLCEAEHAWIFRRHGDVYRFAASFGFAAERHEQIRDYLKSMDVVASPGTAIGRTAMAREPVQIADVLADPDYGWTALQDMAQYRSVMGVPLLRDGETIGILAMTRGTVRPFTDKQTELATTFADQAVIAIENARLFEEVRARTAEVQEALEYQTATSDVLGVISRSPNAIQPVFEAIVSTAKRLCEATDAHIFRLNGDTYELVAHMKSPQARMITQYLLKTPIRVGLRGSVTIRAAEALKPVHVPDSTLDADYDVGLMRQLGRRAILAVPLVRDGVAIGVITMQRHADRPFSQKHIDLVSTFADQAVIAINNVELFEKVETRSRELNEALRQQTATADVLKVISRSAFDLESVLGTLVEAAARLCNADQGTIAREIGGRFMRVGSFGFSAEFDALVHDVPVERERGSAAGRALNDGKIVHIADVLADPEYTFAEGKRLGGFRCILAVPMLKEGQANGVLILTRTRPEPFAEREIELVATFADQAAIAIENVRLFESAERRSRELAQSLEELRGAQDRLVQTEKLASLGQLTAGIAHEIKNPLNFVNNFSAVSAELIDELGEALEGVPLPEAVAEEITDLAGMLKGNLDKIVQHGKRADSIVRNMLMHARQGSGEHRPTDVNALVEESLTLAYHGARAEKAGFNITLERDFDAEAGAVDLYPQEITRVLLNLISNGFYAATKRRTAETDAYEPTLRVATRNLGEAVEITIRDNGTGIPPEVRDKLFAPFFTTKPAGEGTGLGLSISHDIVVKQHRGQLGVRSEPGAFTEFRIVLARDAARETET